MQKPPLAVFAVHFRVTALQLRANAAAIGAEPRASAVLGGRRASRAILAIFDSRRASLESAAALAAAFGSSNLGHHLLLRCLVLLGV